MRKISAILATTRVDLHNEAFALSALQGMVDQVNASYLPMWVEHDPRVPPFGRVASAEIQALENGEFGVAAEIEVFEPGDIIPFDSEGRRTVLRLHRSETVAVVDDRSFASDEDQQLIRQIRSGLGAEASTEGKKALEPISVLTIAVAVVLTNMSSGFLQKIGADAWDSIKPHLKSLFRKKRNSPAQLLAVSVTFELAGEARLVEVIVSDPNDGDVDALSTDVIDAALRDAAKRISQGPYLARLVYDYSASNGLTFSFGVAINGCPVGEAVSTTAPDAKVLSPGDVDKDA